MQRHGFALSLGLRLGLGLGLGLCFGLGLGLGLGLAAGLGLGLGLGHCLGLGPGPALAKRASAKWITWSPSLWTIHGPSLSSRQASPMHMSRARPNWPSIVSLMAMTHGSWGLGGPLAPGLCRQTVGRGANTAKPHLRLAALWAFKMQAAHDAHPWHRRPP